MAGTDKPVGPRGITLLVITGVAGLALGVHGWAGRQTDLTAGSLAASGSSPAHARHDAPAPAHTSGGAKGPRRGKPGPLLSTQSFAPYSHLVWPGTPNAAARTAMTGLRIAVHRSGRGISVSAGVSGQPAPAPRTYPDGARVYVVETSLGDEAGNSDYNLGDDGLIVTDLRGRILP